MSDFSVASRTISIHPLVLGSRTPYQENCVKDLAGFGLSTYIGSLMRRWISVKFHVRLGLMWSVDREFLLIHMIVNLLSPYLFGEGSETVVPPAEYRQSFLRMKASASSEW